MKVKLSSGTLRIRRMVIRIFASVSELLYSVTDSTDAGDARPPDSFGTSNSMLFRSSFIC